MLATPDQIVEALRDYGLTVVERPGWRTRGTRHPFIPIGQAWHHDALSEAVSDARALQIVEEGRPDLSGPLCNGWIDSSSVVYLIAHGNANHAGWNEIDVIDRLRKGLAPLGDARTDPDTDGIVGNPYLWGWECRNAGDGIDVWDQLDAMERAGAALCDVNGWPAAANAAHRELTARKPDPRGFDMRAFRADIAHIQAEHHAPLTATDPLLLSEGPMILILRSGTENVLYDTASGFELPLGKAAEAADIASHTDAHLIEVERSAFDAAPAAAAKVRAGAA